MAPLERNSFAKIHFDCKFLIWAFLVSMQWASLIASPEEIDNGIIGEPEVKCGADVVDMQFRTQKPFRGKIFVKGHYADPDCKVDYSDAGGTEKPNGGIIIHHGACDMQRQRMINPQGMQFSSVIVISFHPVFITKLDKAYHIKCMYRELEKTVTAGLEVSALTTILISHTLPMPQCTYTIRKDEIDGEILKYARVGEQVVHRWQCDTEVYGILVHSCYVEDGQGDKVIVVDENGCHTDRYILGDPTYVEKLNMAYRESHVFKFADRVTVRFQCQIRLCLKAEDGCRGITPPICANLPESSSLLIFSNGTRMFNRTLSGTAAGTAGGDLLASASSSLLVENVENRTRPALRRRFQRDLPNGRLAGEAMKSRLAAYHAFEPIDGDFTSQYFYVLDSTENPEKGSQREQESWKRFLQRAGASGTIVSELHEGVCMSTATFSLLMSAVTIVFMSSAFAAFIIVFQRARKHHKNSKVMDETGMHGSPTGALQAVFGRSTARSTASSSASLRSSSIAASEESHPRSTPCYSHLVAQWNESGTGRK